MSVNQLNCKQSTSQSVNQQTNKQANSQSTNKQASKQSINDAKRAKTVSASCLNMSNADKQWENCQKKKT
jgi:hypothetical protein